MIIPHADFDGRLLTTYSGYRVFVCDTDERYYIRLQIGYLVFDSTEEMFSFVDRTVYK